MVFKPSHITNLKLYKKKSKLGLLGEDFSVYRPGFVKRLLFLIIIVNEEKKKVVYFPKIKPGGVCKRGL